MLSGVGLLEASERGQLILMISHHSEELRISVLSGILLTLEKARKQL